RARNGVKETLVVGTEINLVHRLAKRCQDACSIVPLVDGEAAACPDMAMVTPEKLLASLESIEAGTWKAVVLNEADREPAALSLTRMLKICG
ncbi:MAG: quinolinate synthase NadA, partial [Desulfovibrio sp.]|nr:quinolinate synthase NadA [Desulfovibrio sp.]